jgi:hypothetical protein
MHSELSNIWLFVCVIVKAALMTGLGPGIALAFFGPRAAAQVLPVKMGGLYRIVGYHTGDFIGEVEAVHRDTVHVRVVDPLRPFPRVQNRCSYPECVREDFHNGDHEFVRVRTGAVLEVAWALARFVEAKQVSGGEQLATSHGSTAGDAVPTPIATSNRATSSPRKERRYA